MEEIAIILLLIVLGGGGLLVGLIFAIVTGSARSERLRRLQQDQTELQLELARTTTRVAQLERALGEAMHRLSVLRLPAPETTAAAKAAPAAYSEPRIAAGEPRVASAGEPRVAEPAPYAPAPIPEAALPAPAPLKPAAPVAPVAPVALAPVIAAAAAPEAPSPASPPEAPAVVAEAAASAVPSPAPASEAPVAAPEAAAPQAPMAAPPPAELPEQPEEPPPDAEEPPPSSLKPPVPAIDWERWLGVRGAAAAGAVVLVIAGLYFFKYSIENGLISPTLRVILGVLVGLSGIGASEAMLRRNYTVLANWLAGAGIAILYTSFWAAHGLYQIIGAPVAFGLMILVTVACGLLAMRHDAMVIALLGLLGGFATPVALSTGEDHPFGLFGYLLLLDSALLYLALRRSWPVLGALSVLGTAFYQAAWISDHDRMTPDRFALGIGIVVVFAALYALAAPPAAKGEHFAWKLTRASTVLLPFAFGLYFGVRSDLGDRIYPLAVMLAIVSAGAGWMAREKSTGWASPAAAVAGTTVLGIWLLLHERAAVAWEATACSVLFAGVFHAFVELDARRPRPEARASTMGAAATAAIGMLFCLVASASAPSSLDPRPWIAGWIILGALTVRQSLLPGRSGLRLALAALVDLGFALVHVTHLDVADFPGEQVFMAALAVGTGLGLLSAAMLARTGARQPASTARATRARSRDGLAVLVPFLPALYFASRPELGPHLVPLGGALVLLAAGATWAARAAGETWLTACASLAGLSVLALWLGRHDLPPVAAEASLGVCLFAGAFYAFAEFEARRGAPAGWAPSTPWVGRWAALTSILAIVVLAGVAVVRVDPWPWAFGWALLAAMALRQCALPDREPLHLGLGLVLGLAFPIVQGAHAGDPAFPGASVWLAAALASAVVVAGGGLVSRRRDEPGMRWASHGAALLALLAMLGALVGSRLPAPPAFVQLYVVALLAVALLSAARIGAGGWSLAAHLTAAFFQTVWAFDHVRAPIASELERSTATAALGGSALAVALAAAFPLVAGKRLQKSPWAWRAAALAALFWFAALHHTWTSLFGKGAIGLLPLSLGALAFGVAWRARDLLPAEDDGLRRTALVWLFGTTLSAISLAIPLQLENEWVTVGWAIEGAALLALWRRIDHAGLKYTALAHLAVVVVRLVANPSLFEYHPRASVPVFNWLAYTYWIPVAALFGAWWLLRDLEAPRGRDWEHGLYENERPVFAMGAAASAIVVFFVWINLTIFDAFGTGSALAVDFERLPARDLTLSLAWAIYALVLLTAGIVRRSAALRWTSLLLILVTVGKVFLWDLSHLHDLYRVMSLVGLAFSLILIALAYQRFVFGKRAEEAE